MKEEQHSLFDEEDHEVTYRSIYLFFYLSIYLSIYLSRRWNKMEYQAKYYLHKSLCGVSGDMQRRRPQAM